MSAAALPTPGPSTPGSTTPPATAPLGALYTPQRHPLPYHLINAFATSAHSSGNQAAVVVLSPSASSAAYTDAWHVHVAADFGFAETAFVVPLDLAADEPVYEIRFFTPTVEVPMCGHATLAAGHALLSYIHATARAVHFRTRVRGSLAASIVEGSRRGAGARIALDFPLTVPQAPPDDTIASKIAALVAAAAGVPAHDVIQVAAADFGTGTGVIVEVKPEVDLRSLRVDTKPLSRRETQLTMITQLAGASPTTPNAIRINTRVFAPHIGIDEDPVTGAAHTALVPYYLDGPATERVRALLPAGADPRAAIVDAHQLSARGGAIEGSIVNGRAKLVGRAWRWGKGELTEEDE
ncbi:putative isomerase [Vanrija pseudolonga]|uniref:Purtative isomerase n=1 Tax=Vanrija pseudolonga TaxID=143232 RepID=A0AAF0Y3F7_9TREE|nr:purtative isomerase [Vanrija pseudolonga]